MKKLILLSSAVLIILSATASSKVYRGHCKGLHKTMLMAKHKSMARYR